MLRLTYPLKFEPDDNDTILVTCPDLPELTTFGDDEADALKHAADALRAVAMLYEEQGMRMPEPSTPARGQLTVTLSLPL